jgi:Tfp pilus assembly protein PilF
MTRKALALNDQDYMVWENLAIAYRWLHDDANVRYADQKTKALLEEYVGKHPQDATAHGDLADLYATSKDREKAVRELATALALQPNDPRVLSDAAQAYEALGERKRAIEYTVKSLQNGNTLDFFKTLPDMQGVLADANFHAPGGSAGTNK